MLLCSLNAICYTAGDMFFPKEYLCQLVAAFDSFSMLCLAYNGCFPLDWTAAAQYTTSCTVFLKELSLWPPYRSLYESISLLQTASHWKWPLPSFRHQSPILHSRHTLLLHFTWDTHRVAASRSVFKHQRFLCSPVLSGVVRNKTTAT